MSLYSFIYGINPKHKEILEHIKVAGENLNLPKEGKTLITRFRDVYYKNGVASVLARIGGKVKHEYKEIYKGIEENENYIKSIDFLSRDNYMLFEFKCSKEFTRYSLDRKIFKKGYAKEHQTQEQLNFLNKLGAKIQDKGEFTEEEIKQSPYNIHIIKKKNKNFSFSDGNTLIQVCSIANIKNINFDRVDAVITLMDREDILQVVESTKDIRKKIKT